MKKFPRRNIALIGFMAVGKSAVGRNLARKLRRRFVDLDREIERSAGMKIRQIFASQGEAHFRRLEKETLAAVLERKGQVLATGGGVVLDDENLALLLEKTIVVGLTAPVDTLLARAGNGAKRPLLKGGDRRRRIEQLLGERQNRYERAHLTLDTSALTPEQAAEQIIDRLSLEGGPHADAHG